MFRKIILRLIFLILYTGIIINLTIVYMPSPVRIVHIIEKDIYPVYLSIPSIGIKTTVESMSVAEDGTMEVPSRTNIVSWYKLGARPGTIGNAVIAGHYDNMFGLPAVFYKLNKLKIGDEVIIENNDKSIIRFKVVKSTSYNSKVISDEVFGPTTAYRLNLITCDGKWNPQNGSYPNRLVVFTEKEV
ncbi:MAG: class F sortase [Patescibacteria group bacterium]|nr:class F sortase [Patescibacteria group bacterium]